MTLLRKCPKCRSYTLKRNCPKDNFETIDAHYKFKRIRDALKSFRRD